MFRKKSSITNRNRRSEVLNSKSPFSYIESYNMLRTNLSFVSSANDWKSIVITSALPEEGKSTVAINTAISLAKTGKSVLLIDADLRKPSLQKYLNIKSGFVVGLTDVLAKQVQYFEAIQEHKDLGLSIMLSGTRVSNPAELLTNQNIDQLFKLLEEEYDYIIVDTPPVGLVSDASLLTRVVDGSIVVVRQDFALKDEIYKAIENLNSVNTNIIGLVFNNYIPKKDFKSGNLRAYGEYYGE